MANIDFPQIINAIGDAIVISDGKGLITLWNPGAERMFGFTEKEAIGQSLDIFIPERLRARHWEGYHQTMASGKTKYGTELLRVPAVHKDGRAMSIAFTVAMLFKSDGSPDAIVAVIRDETTRFNEERALKKRVTELEAQAGKAP